MALYSLDPLSISSLTFFVFINFSEFSRMGAILGLSIGLMERYNIAQLDHQIEVTVH